MSIAAKCNCGKSAYFCTGMCRDFERMNFPGKDGSDIHQPTAQKQIEELQFILHGLEEGSANWEFEYRSCREILQKLVDVSKQNTAEAPMELIRLYKVAEEFLSKFQHID